MKSWLNRMCAAGLLAGTALGTSSCADNENMLVILGAMSAQPPDCTYTAAAGSLLLFNGAVDPYFGGRYVAVLLVANQLAARGDKSRLRAESGDITIDNAVVSLMGDGGNSLGASYSVPASGHVVVGSGEDVGYGAIPVEILQRNSSIDITGSQYIMAEVKLQGKTSGGRDIESNVFRYEIYVRNLVSYNAATGCDLSLCANTSSSSSGSAYCYMGQDVAVDCCDCPTEDHCLYSN